MKKTDSTSDIIAGDIVEIYLCHGAWGSPRYNWVLGVYVNDSMELGVCYVFESEETRSIPLHNIRKVKNEIKI